MKAFLRAATWFSSIGFVAAVAYVLISTLIARAGFTPWIVSTACYASFIPLVYLAQKRIAFRSDTEHRSSFPKYLVAQAAGLTLAALLPYMLGKTVAPSLAFLAVGVSAATINFFVLKCWVFKQRSTG